MTMRRRDASEETLFGAWVRAHPDLDSQDHGLTVTDADWFFHKYITEVDAMGTRTVQAMFMLEVKCHGAVPSQSQQETLAFNHQLLRKVGVKVKRAYAEPITLWHFGVYVLSLSGTSPDNSDACRWGRFTDSGRNMRLAWDNCLPPGMLSSILGFDIRPDTYGPLALRRHHQKKIITYRETMPNGIVTDVYMTQRS